MTASLENYSCKRCRSHAGFIFQPKKESKKSLEALSEKISKRGAQINALTPAILAAKYKGTLVTFYANGKAMVKSASEKNARRILLELIG